MQISIGYRFWARVCASANHILALKYYCQDLLKMRSEELALKHTVIFAPDLIEYAFIGVSLSDATFMGEEY